MQKNKSFLLLSDCVEYNNRKQTARAQQAMQAFWARPERERLEAFACFIPVFSVALKALAANEMLSEARRSLVSMSLGDPKLSNLCDGLRLVQMSIDSISRETMARAHDAAMPLGISSFYDPPEEDEA
jgi:hypothetical protein